MGIHREGGHTFAQIERVTPVLQLNQSSLRSFNSSRHIGEGGPVGQREQLMVEGRKARKSLMKREK